MRSAAHDPLVKSPQRPYALHLIATFDRRLGETPRPTCPITRRWGKSLVLQGRIWMSRRKPDRTLLGFCSAPSASQPHLQIGNGVVLAALGAVTLRLRLNGEGLAVGIDADRHVPIRAENIFSP